MMQGRDRQALLPRAKRAWRVALPLLGGCLGLFTPTMPLRAAPQVSTEQLQWVLASSSAPMAQTDRLDLVKIRLDRSAERVLEVGAWTLVRLSGLGRVRLQGTGVVEAGLSAQEVLGERGQARMTAPLHDVGTEALELRNVSVAPRLFLVGGAKRKLSLELLAQASVRPDLAWDKASAELLAGLAKGGKEVEWLSQKPEVQGVLATRAHLASRFPGRRDAVDAWARWALAKSLLTLRPVSLTGWSKTALVPQGAQETWTHKDQSGQEKVYTRVTGPRTLWVNTKGPGVLDIEFRALVGRESSAPTLSVHAQGLLVGELETSLTPAKFPCKDGAPHLRCPVKVDAQGMLGRVARRRVALLGDQATRVRIDVQGGGALLRLRQDRLRPRLGKDPLRRQSLLACSELKSELSALSPKTEIAILLQALSAGCVGSPTGRKRAQVAALNLMCTRVQEPVNSWLARTLVLLGEPPAARRCAGASLERQTEPGTTPSTMAFLAGLYPALVADSVAAWSAGLRAQFLQDWRQRSRWIRLKPQQRGIPAQSWIVDAEPALGPSGEAWHPVRSWSAIESGEVYKIDALAFDEHQPRLSRVDLAWTKANPPSRIMIDDQLQQLDPGRSRGSWLLSPGPHRIQVDAPKQAKLFATLAPRQSDGAKRAREIKLWPLYAGGEPLSFELPTGAGTLPVRVTLRAKGATPKGAQTLWLRDDRGTKIRIDLLGHPLAQQDALALDGPSQISVPLHFEAVLSSQATRVWLEGETAAPEQYFVSIHRRGPSLALDDEPVAPARQNVAMKTDGRSGEQSSANPEIAQAQRFLAQKQWGPLRNLLVQWSSQPASVLKKHRTERLALFNAYRGYLNENARAYKVVKQEKLPAVMSVPFLADRQRLSLQGASGKLQTAANGLETPTGIQDAVWAAYRFSDAAQDADAASNKLWPLAYGLMNLPGYQIDNPRLNALRARSAKHTRWQTLDFATQSSGFEHIERSGLSKAHLADPLGSPLEQAPGAFAVVARQTRTLSVNNAALGELRLSAFCRSAVGQNEVPSISVSIDDAKAEVYELRSGKAMELQWSVEPGPHTLSVQGSPASRCVLRVQSKQVDQADWSTVAMPSKQRWFATGPKRALSFHAQGPGVLALQTRALGKVSSGRAQLLVKRSSKTSSAQLRLELPSLEDPEYSLSRDPKLTVNAAEQNFVVLPDDQVYLIELTSPEREVLVKAKVRVPDTPAAEPLVKQDWTKSLGAQLASDQAAGRRAVHFPVNQIGARRVFKPASSRLGSFDVAMQTGIERDTQFETIQSRMVSGVSATYRKALVDERLWLRGQALIQSQRLAAPMFAGQVQLSAQAKKAPIRARLFTQVGLQPVSGQAPVAGRAWVDVEASVRNAYRRSSTWDLRPSLRLDTRMIGAVAQELGTNDREQVLNSSIYRKYAVDHAVSLKPKLVWTYRDFRNARIDLGTDLWLNADFKGLDRTRAWLRFAGIYRRSSKRPSWWIYQAGYRWTYALVDAHRRNAYMRHAVQGQLRFAWQWAKKRRLHVTLADTLLFSEGGFAGNEIRLNLGVRFDPLEAFGHSAPHERRFLGEFARKDWKVVGLR